MAQSSGFFLSMNDASGNPDRVYLADQFADYFASFISNGVYANTMNELQVVALASPDMKVNVSSGKAFTNGYWYKNDSSYELPIDIADGVAPRIDSIVVRLDYSERDTYVAVKKGTPSAKPSAPALQRDADAYELQLATINISAGATSISQSMITDTRPNEDVCGWVTGVIDQIDTANLFAQFQAAFDEAYVGFENQLADSKLEFEEWFESIKNILPDDVAIPITVLDVEDIWNGTYVGS